MRNNQQGFTLIELVVVIVILGILAATALPKFLDLSTEAGNAATKGVAGAIASSSAVNYAAAVAGKSGTTALNVADVCTKANMEALVRGVTFTTLSGVSANADSYNVITGTGSCATSPGTAVKCVIQGFKGASYQATVICTN